MSTTSGGNRYCKPCKAEQQKKYYAKNADRMKVKMTQRLYGLTENEALEMRSREGCDVCGQNRIGKGLHIDHDHQTGRVRGALCHGCNLALGNVEDDPERLRALADYLERNSN